MNDDNRQIITAFLLIFALAIATVIIGDSVLDDSPPSPPNSIYKPAPVPVNTKSCIVEGIGEVIIIDCKSIEDCKRHCKILRCKEACSNKCERRIK